LPFTTHPLGKSLLFIALAALACKAFEPCSRAQAPAPQTFVLSHDEYLDRVKAIWLAQMIGQATGVRFEHQVDSVLPVTPPSKLPGYAPIDDDYYYEMVAVRGFERYGIYMTVQQLGQQWLANSAGAWGSSRQALLLMRRGVLPPDTGSPRYNKLWWTIGAQFSSDLYGALSPAMPLQAARLARQYGHLNGYAEGVDGGVFISGMISIAFQQHDSHQVVKQAASLIAASSPYRQALDTVISMAEAGQPASTIYQALDHRWGIEYPGTNNAVLNGAIVATTVWFGEGDYQKTLQLAVHAADYTDADCNAANAESVVAAMRGTRALPQTEVDALHDRVKGDSLGPEQLTPPVDESISELARRTAAIGEAILQDRGVRLTNGTLPIPIEAPIEQPAEPFHLADLTQFWNPDWQLLRAGFGGGDGGLEGIPGMTYLDGDTLATWPYDEVRGVLLERKMELGPAPALDFEVGVDIGRSWRLQAYVNDRRVLNQVIEAPDTSPQRQPPAIPHPAARHWRNIHLDLRQYQGQEVVFRLYQLTLNTPEMPGTAYWKHLTVLSKISPTAASNKTDGPATLTKIP
jgi:hypothetical protein